MFTTHTMKTVNFVHFHRRRILSAIGFMGCYSYLCKKSINSNNDIVRMGVAGSLANLTVESMFHFVDTVNVRAKLSDSHDSSLKIATKIYAKEGIQGFSKGFSACFYGSAVCGFLYFSLYKVFKVYSKEWFGDKYNVTFLFFGAAFAAEFFTLLVYYPYDLVKCRLQSKNFIFKYRNLPHAFRKEISEGSILSLYRGSFPFLVTYCFFVSIQFTIYEFIIKHYKTLYGNTYD